MGESEVALCKDARSTAEYRESLSILHHEARRLSRVVDDMFTLSRADAGQYPVTPREFYIDELAADCVQSMRSLAAAKSISLSIQSPSELPLLAGGVITVATSASPEAAEVTVADTGPGIPAELQSRIFERFFRADQARTRSNSDSGAGLGLSIAKWIAEAHRGGLQLTRSDASGSVFTARIPRNPQAPTLSH
jgi:signal transduction histidine kinase